MKKKIKNKIRDFIRLVLGPLNYTKIRFFLVHGYLANLKEPRSFSEKIIKRKFDNNSSRFSKLVDKYTVRNYVAHKIGSDYLIPLIKVVDRLELSDFNDLPMSFVIKNTNGGGGENVLLVENKKKLDLEVVCRRFNGYLNYKIGSRIDEKFYDIERPRIVVEHLIKNKDGSYPSDYKFHVFNGVNGKVIIQVDADRFGNHKRSLYDENLNRLSFDIQPKYSPIDDDYKFPSNMTELMILAKKLADDFSYVRVDMYNVDGRIYFGEMTFCHGSGWEPISPTSADFLLGSYWQGSH